MDEYDFNDVEDELEFEAHIYGQIHHRATKVNDLAASTSIVEPAPSIQRIVTKNSVINKTVGANRYWAGFKQKAESSAGDYKAAQMPQFLPSNKAVQMPQLLASNKEVQLSVAAKTHVAQSQNITVASSSSAAVEKIGSSFSSDLQSGFESKLQNIPNASKHSSTTKDVQPDVGENSSQKLQRPCHGVDMNTSLLSRQTQSQSTTAASSSLAAIKQMGPPPNSDLQSSTKSKSQNIPNAPKHSSTSQAVPPNVGENSSKKQQHQCHGEVMKTSSSPPTQPESQNTTPANSLSAAVEKMGPPSSSDFQRDTKSKSQNIPNAPKQSSTTKAIHGGDMNASSLRSHQTPSDRRVKLKKEIKRLQNIRQQKKAMPLKRKMPEPTDVAIVLLSDESDDDIIMIPIPVPLITIKDSDDDENEAGNKCKVIKNPAAKAAQFLRRKAKSGGNAVDNNIKQPASTSFAKPQAQREQKADNSSRCTSPCSVLSSDDFIGQTDHRRMLQSAVMADDLDLQAVPADVSSVVKNACILKATVTASKDKSVAVAATAPTKVVTSVENNSSKVFDNSKTSSDNEVIDIMLPPADTPNRKKENYRIEQTNCRAFDVYESESDVTDSVYSKGAAKPAVKRTISSSSDENIENTAHLMRANQIKKRLRKSHASMDDTANRLSLSLCDSDSETQCDNAQSDTEVLMVGDSLPALPYIARGPALDKPKPSRKCRKGSLSPRIRRSSVGGASAGHMSDHDFIATLNTLAKCHGSDSYDSDVIDCDEELRAERFKTKVLNQLVATSGGTVTADGVVAALSPVSVCDTEPSTSQAAAAMEPEEKRGSMLTPHHNFKRIIKMIDEFNPNELENNVAQHSSPKLPAVRTEDENPMRLYRFNTSTTNRIEDMWNEEMRRFYNDSWNGENFTLSAVTREMKYTKGMWNITNEDRRSNLRNYSIKCTNCREYGHYRQRCPQRFKQPVCVMCGQSGHIESRCPNSICLRCGTKSDVFTRDCNSCSFLNRITCMVCNMRGHKLSDCPDKWRRYHSTTSQCDTLNSVIEYKPRFNCCICGARGHLPENCRYPTRFTDYPPTTAFIHSYQLVYHHSNKANKAISCNLLYNPNTKIEFRLPENIHSSSFYERFLHAVGLPSSKEMLRQRKLSLRPIEITTYGKKFVLNPCSQAGHRRQRSLGAQSNLTLTGSSTVQIEEISESSNQTTSASMAKASVVVVVDNDANDDNAVIIDISSNETTSTANDRNPDEAMTTDTDQQNNFVQKKIAIYDPGSFKAPTPVPAQQHITKEMDTDALLNEGNSDSNYSFSEHFDDMPLESESHTPQIASNVLTERADIATCSTGELPKKCPPQMEPMPDFISINSPTATEDVEDVDHYNQLEMMESTDLCVLHMEDPADINGPSEAKIYLTPVHASFLLSPPGHEFLLTTSKLFKLKMRIDWTKLGHVLFINGLPKNQDRFQEALREKYDELLNEQLYKRAEMAHNIPKRTDVLIRFLRHGICQLFEYVGNARGTFNRLTYLEKQQSKSALKQADKMRRQLNMILLGQAGLRNGDKHLQKLLEILRNLLIDSNQKAMVVSKELREEIDDHWKPIFTSHRHEDYTEMIACYNQMEQKNHVNQLNIDPKLLGKSVLNTTLTEEQKQKMEAKHIVKTPPPTPASKPSTSAANMALLAKSCLNPCLKQVTQSKAPLQPTTLMTGVNKYENRDSPYPNDIQQRRDPSLTSTDLGATYATQTPRGKILQYDPTPPVPSAQSDRRSNNNAPLPAKTVPLPASPTGSQLRKSNENYRYNSINDSLGSSSQSLSDRSGFGESVGSSDFDPTKPDNNNTEPSVVWSRKSIKFINRCVETIDAEHHLHDIICRLQSKTLSGQLTYSEYRTIIKIYNQIVNNQSTDKRDGDLYRRN